MLKSYLKSAVRNIYRNKLYTGVSVIGLGIGLAVCLLALQYLTYEFGFDNVKDGRRVYEVAIRTHLGDASSTRAGTPPGLGEMLKSHFNEIETGVSVYPMTLHLATIANPERSLKADFWGVGPDFFRIFGYKLLEGDPSTCLSAPNSIVLTRALAMKYFGKLNVIGETVPVKTGISETGTHECIVTGVMQDVPAKSSFSFDAVGSGRIFRFINQYAEKPFSWNWTSPYCFIKLRPGAEPGGVTRRLPSFVKKTGGDPGFQVPVFVPIKQVHFRTDIITDFSTYPLKYLYILSGVAMLVLLVSVLNFLGISLTLFSRRLKEVGIRRVIGANVADLSAQFAIENTTLVIMALFVSVCGAEMMLPLFNKLMGVDIGANFMAQPASLLMLLALGAVLVGLLRVSSTRFFSSARPQLLIRGTSGKAFMTGVSKKALVAIQFAVGAFLICSAVVMVDQLNFMRHKDLGFNPNNILVIGDESVGNNGSILRTELLRDPDIRAVSVTGWVPGTGEASSEWAGGDNGHNGPLTIQMAWVDENFIPTLGMQLIRGSNFDPRISTEASDRTDSGTVIMNEAAYRELSAVMPVKDSANFGGNHWRVAGIVRDFNYQSLKDDVKPLVLFLAKKPYNPSLVLKIRKGSEREVVSYVTATLKKVNPNLTLNYSFLRDSINKMYTDEDRMFTALLSGSVLAVFIALMGIFALSSFLVETKTKEIAVRKVLGSSISGIIELLSEDFIKMVLIANIIAWPGAYIVMHSWLQNYAYRISIDLFVFPLVGLTMMSLALVTILVRAMRAARANPVESLRYE